MDTENYYAETAMMIRKPIHEVFKAFIDPEITTKFWFTKSSGNLLESKAVTWTWEMFNHSVEVLPLSITTNEKIKIQWGDDREALVHFKFEAISQNKTFVSIYNTGLKGSTSDIIAQIRDATGGFSWVLAGLKAYLEHDIQLHLIADRYHNKE